MVEPQMLEQANDNYLQVNDAKDLAPVVPAIIDPGQYDLTWILTPGDSIEELKHHQSLTEEDIKTAITNKHYVD